MTTPGGGYSIRPEELDAQAQDLHTFADNLRSARATATNTTSAFGLVGMSWSWALNNWYDDANVFTDSAAKAADNVAAELTNMARNYENMEDTTAGNLRRTGGDQP